MVKAAAIRDIVPKNAGTEPTPKAHVAAVDESSAVLAGLEINDLISRSGLDPESVEKIMPALPMQVHMLSIWENSRGKLYFYDFSYEILGDISQDQIVSAWHALVDELPILRTYFAATNSIRVPFVQVIARPSTQIPQATGAADAISTQGVWLEANPFVCLHVAKAADSAFKLTLKIHHALYDGVSLPFIINRFASLCHAKEPPSQDHSALWDTFVYSHYNEELRQQRKNFWSAYLQDAAAPSRHTTALDLDSRTAVYRPGALDDLTRIKATALELGISVQALFFAAYAQYQTRSSDTADAPASHDIIFGIYLANRTAFDEKLQDASYPTLSIVPLRIQFHQDESVATIARRVQDDLAKISAHENATVGLWEIAEWTGVKLTAFVNFLALPPHLDGESQADGLHIKEVTPSVHPEYEQNAAEVLKLARLDDAWLVNNQVKNAYIKAIDVEAAIRGNGLDIGVFGSSSLVREDHALDLIHFVVGLLREV